jgi:hypothetical protein
MRTTRGDVREDHIVSSKIDHGPSSGIEKPHSRRDVQKSTFARFLGLIDFRLLQHYPPQEQTSSGCPGMSVSAMKRLMHRSNYLLYSIT